MAWWTVFACFDSFCGNATSNSAIVCVWGFLFLAAHSLTSSFIALDLAFEHRNYIALLGVVIAVCDIVRLVLAKISASVLTALVTAVLILLGTATTIRALTWSNPIVLANSFAKDAPESPRAAYTLGVLMIRNSGGDAGSIAYGLGMMHLMRASEMRFASPLPMQAMIIVHAKTGQPVPDEWWQALMKKFAERSIGAQEQSAYGTLISERIAGLPLSDIRLQELSELVVRQRPDLKELHLYYADFARSRLKDRELATQEYRKAIALTPPKQRLAFVEQVMSNLVSEGIQIWPWHWSNKMSLACHYCRRFHRVSVWNVWRFAYGTGHGSTVVLLTG
ncbi:hypothetical protein WIW49_17435 [Xanthomonas euroxanthea]